MSRSLLKRYELPAFFVLAYALSWTPSPGSVVPLGPLAAAVIVLSLTGGRPALEAFFRAGFRWRVAPRWYALAILVPPAATLAAVVATAAVGGVADTSKLPPLLEVLALPFVFFVMVGMGEEFAWRGFALPRLASRYGLPGGAFVLGVVHVFWHAPLIGTDFTASEAVPEALAVVAFSMFAARLWRGTAGSTFLPALAHVAVNTVGGPTLFRLFGSDDRLTLYWAWALLWVLAAGGTWVLLSRSAPLPGLEVPGAA